MNTLINQNIEFNYAGLFSSDKEWIHPKRIEKTYEIIYVVKGEVYMREGKTEYRLSKGQALILLPSICHYGTRYSADVEFYWVHFAVKEGKLPFENRYFDAFESSYLFKELLHFNNLPQIPGYLINSVLVHILSEFCWISEKVITSYDTQAEKIREWIRINVSATLTVKKTAEHFGYSPDHLSRICKKSYGIGARELINRFLISKAKELLCNTNKYVKEIAAELEFSSDKAFIGYFKYHEGCFPSVFRNRFAKLHMNRK